MYQLVPPDDPGLSLREAPASPYINPVEEFTARLHASTPAVFVTHALLGINVLVFLAMIITGVDVMNPTPEALIHWGANFGPSTATAGQWWRLLTSMFLHVGLIHLAFNMFVLFQIGPFLERLLGNTGFFIVYLASGLAGSCVSLAWNPDHVSAGASGAIFGLYGALLGFLVRSKDDSIPDEMLSSLMKSALVFLGYNAVFGLVNAGTDLAAHAGGLTMGFLCGLTLSTSLLVDPRRQRSLRNAVVALGASALIFGTAVALPRPVDLRAELLKFSSVEHMALAAFNAAVNRGRTTNLRDMQSVADTIEKDVLPEWRKEHDALAKLNRLPEKQQRLVSSLVQYMEARRQAWSMLVQGIRTRDINLLKQAGVKQREADSLGKQLAPTPR